MIGFAGIGGFDKLGRAGLSPIDWWPSSGGAPYVASAVHFDGSTLVETANLIATNKRYIGISFWRKADALALAAQYQVIGYRANPSIGFNFTVDDPTNSELRIFTDGSNGVKIDTISGSDVPDVWVNVRVNVDLISQVGKIFYGLSDVTGFVTPIGAGSDAVLNNLNIGVPDVSSNFYPMIGDMADFCLFASDSPIDMAQNADGGLFISAGGKPVDPSGSPSSLILLSGDADTFAINQGTGGTFTLTGTLTNASTSPSD